MKDVELIMEYKLFFLIKLLGKSTLKWLGKTTSFKKTNFERKNEWYVMLFFKIVFYK